jgi:hypothetical protein
MLWTVQEVNATLKMKALSDAEEIQKANLQLAEDEKRQYHFNKEIKGMWRNLNRHHRSMSIPM